MSQNLRVCAVEAARSQAEPTARPEGWPDIDMDVVNEQLRNPPPEVKAAYARLGEVAREFRAKKALKTARDV
jgi:hypothetical protein